jgi:hypothetical protein
MSSTTSASEFTEESFYVSNQSALGCSTGEVCTRSGVKIAFGTAAWIGD